MITGKWANGKGKPLDGGFAFKVLTKQVDANIVLRMERDEMVDTVIASHHDSNRRRGGSLIPYDTMDYKYLVGRNSDGHGFYLIWEGPDGNTDLTENAYEACVAEGKRAKLEPVYHVYARYNLYGTEDVRFYRIPDQILIDFATPKAVASSGEVSPASYRVTTSFFADSLSLVHLRRSRASAGAAAESLVASRICRKPAVPTPVSELLEQR